MSRKIQLLMISFIAGSMLTLGGCNKKAAKVVPPASPAPATPTQPSQPIPSSSSKDNPPS